MITIPEMLRLPNNCHECPFSFWDEESYERWCPWHNCTVDDYGGNKMRMNDCPLADGKLIDASYLLNLLKCEEYESCTWKNCSDCNKEKCIKKHDILEALSIIETDNERICTDVIKAESEDKDE